jgi:hypothetical protein
MTYFYCFRPYIRRFKNQVLIFYFSFYLTFSFLLDHRETLVDQKKEKKRQEILDRIERFQKEFINRKDE